jgi:3-phytase
VPSGESDRIKRDRLRPVSVAGLAVVFCTAASSCGSGAPASTVPLVANIKPVRASATLTHDPDDPAIWVHPSAPERSLVLGTIKAAAPDGGVAVFGLDGTLRQLVTGIDRPNNIDVEYGFAFGGRMIDIAVATERYQRRLRVFSIASDGSGISDLGTVPVLEGQAGEAGAPMGIGLYRRPRDGAVFAIVAPKTGPADGYLWQYKLEDAGGGRLAAVFVRRFGRFSGAGEIEAVAVDDEAGHVYYADEGNGLHQWAADPERADASTELAHFARDGFSGDREGIAIYAGRGGVGYIIATDQLPGNSRYHLYRRDARPGASPDHRVVRVFAGDADSTDGIEATSRALGPDFPGGLFVAMNSGARNFLFYRWSDIQAATIDNTSER